jgi:hypothetical protein
VNKLILIGLQVPQVRYVSVLFFGRNLFNGKHAFGEIRLRQKFSCVNFHVQLSKDPCQERLIYIFSLKREKSTQIVLDPLARKEKIVLS